MRCQVRDVRGASSCVFCLWHRVSPDVQLLCAVIGSDWVMLSDNWTDNDSGAYQCQHMGTPAKCMRAITAVAMLGTTVLHGVTSAYRDKNSCSVGFFLNCIFFHHAALSFCLPLPTPSTPFFLPSQMRWGDGLFHYMNAIKGVVNENG